MSDLCLPTSRRYAIELGLALLAYLALVLASVKLMHFVPMARSWQVAVSLVPILPAGAVCWAILRHLRRLDELQRQVQLEALSLSFAATALITISYGFLEGVGFPRLSMFMVWPLMGVLWSLFGVLARRRYR